MTEFYMKELDRLSSRVKELEAKLHLASDAHSVSLTRALAAESALASARAILRMACFANATGVDEWLASHPEPAAVAWDIRGKEPVLVAAPCAEPTLEHVKLRDWFNSLEEPFRSYVHWLDTNADPSGNIRDAVCWKENALAMAAKVAAPCAGCAELLHWCRLVKDQQQAIDAAIAELDSVTSETLDATVAVGYALSALRAARGAQ